MERTGSDGRRGARAAAAILIAAAAVFASFSGPRGLHAQANPFFSAPGAARPASSPSAVAPARFARLAAAQRAVREALTDTIGAGGESKGGSLALPAMAFMYGLLHALGPGHRKIALAAYFVARPARLIDGVVVGGLVALLHAVSAVTIVYGLFFVLRRSLSQAFSSISAVFEQVSYGAIALIGAVLLVLAIREWITDARSRGRGDIHGGEGHHAPGCPAEISKQPRGGSRRTRAAMVVGSGVVPCPGSALLLILCLAEGVPVTGLLAAFAMAGGEAVVTIAVSIAAVLGKRGVQRAASAESVLARLLHHGLEILGSVTILVFGLLMLAPSAA